MADTIIKAGIQINAQVGGGEQIDKLVKSIAETSNETSQLSQEAQKLAQEWQKAQQNQALIEHYKTAKNSLAENRQEIADTEQQLRKLYVQMSDGKTKQQEQQFNQLKEKLVQLNQQKRTLSDSLRKASLSMNDAGIATKHLANNQKYFADQAQKAEQKLKELNQQAQKVQQIAQSKAILGMDVDDRARQEIAELDKAFADLKRNGGLSQAELARAAQLHAQKVGEIEQSLQRVKPTLGEVAQAVGGLASQATGLTYLAKQAMSFETAMASVKKVTDGTPEQYEKLSSEIKKMAGELGVLPAELAEIAAAGGQANVALGDLPKFTRMAAEMAVAFKIPAEQAGDMAAKIGNVFQIPIDKVGELMDAVNVLGNNTAAKEAEISDVLMRIGGNAKQFGLVAEEAAALGAAFISLGKTPEVAGTAINALLTKLQTSTEQGADFKNSLKDIGLTAQEMADNIAANPQTALTNFLQRLEQLDKQSRSIVLTKMFGAEYSDDLALLAGSLKTYEDALSTATDKTKTFGAMQKEAGAALETTEGKMRQAKADISAAAIDLGNALLPVVQATAVAVGGIAEAVQAVSTQFPVLSQLAVLFAGAKVASMALGGAMKLAGVDGQASFLKSDVSAQKLKVSLLETATAAKALGANIKAATVGNVNDIDLKTNAVKDLGSKLAGAAQNAVALYSAFEVGHSFGTALREQSTLVRDLGDNMGKAIAYADALFTDRTFDDVREHYRTTRQEIREQEKAQRDAAKSAEERAEKEKQANETQAQKIRELTETYRDQQAEYQGNEQSLRVLTAAGKENGVIADQLRERNKQLEQQLAQTKDKLVALNANIADTSPLAKNRQALSDLGLTAEQVATGISQSAKKSLDDFKLAAEGFGNDADAMSQIFQAAVKKMDSPEALAELKKSLTEVGQNAGLSAEQIDRIAQFAPQAGLGLAQISKPLGEAEKAATALGVSLENAFAGSSPAMQTALSHFTTLRGQLSALAEQGLDTGLILQQSLAKLTETAQSQADIDALKQSIQSLGQSGALSMQDVERAILTADTRLQELKGNIDPTEAAFKKLGIQSRESLRLAAEETRLAFEAVKASGNATAADLQAAFERTASALLATGDSNQQAWVESQAAAYNYKVVVDETGKANIQAAEKTVEAAKTQVAAHNQVAQVAEKTVQSNDKATESVNKHVAAVTRLSEVGMTAGKMMNGFGGLGKWMRMLGESKLLYRQVHLAIDDVNNSLKTGENLALNLARAESLAIKNAEILGKQTLDKLRAAIHDAREQMAQFAEEAANARAEAEKELLSAQGRDDEVAKREQQQKIAEWRKKQAQAQRMGNQQIAQDYAAAIAASNQAFNERLRREAEQRQANSEQTQKMEWQKQQINQEPSVHVQADLSQLISTLQQRDDAVADAAIKKLLNDLQEALLRGR